MNRSELTSGGFGAFEFEIAIMCMRLDPTH